MNAELSAADRERVEKLAEHLEQTAHICRLNALDAEAGKNIPQEVSADYGKRAAENYSAQAANHEADAAALRNLLALPPVTSGSEWVVVRPADLEKLRELSGEASRLEGQIDPNPAPFDRANRIRIKEARDAWKAFDAHLDALIAAAPSPQTNEVM